MARNVFGKIGRRGVVIWSEEYSLKRNVLSGEENPWSLRS